MSRADASATSPASTGRADLSHRHRRAARRVGKFGRAGRRGETDRADALEGCLATASATTCHRWLQAEGRPEEALAWALGSRCTACRGRLTVELSYDDGRQRRGLRLSAGRIDAAEQHCREALEKLAALVGRSRRGDARLRVHGSGPDAEAIEHARAALAASRDPGLHFRLLEALALCAARQGRRQDAAWVVGYVDRLYGVAGEGALALRAAAPRRARRTARRYDRWAEPPRRVGTPKAGR